MAPTIVRHRADTRRRRQPDLLVLGDSRAGPALLVGHCMGGMVLLTFCRQFPEHLGSRVRGLALVDTSYTNPARTTTASAFVEAIQKPSVEPLLHVTAWLAPLVWMFFGFAGTQTRGQLDLVARYNVLAWLCAFADEIFAAAQHVHLQAG